MTNDIIAFLISLFIVGMGYIYYAHLEEIEYERKKMIDEFLT